MIPETTAAHSAQIEGGAGRALFVDDEEYILNSLQRLFRDSGIEVLVALNAEEALTVAANQPLDLVVADYRMPGEDGVSLLRQVKREHPLVSRAILSGYIEDPAVFRSLSSGLAGSFFAKPWDDSLLIERLNHIIATRRALEERKLLDLINQMHNVPTLPTLFMELLDDIEHDRSMRDIEETVSHDPSVAAMILHVVNSAFYGTDRYGKVSSLREALVRLGLAHLKDLVLTVTLFDGISWTSRFGRAVRDLFIRSVVANNYLPLLYEEIYGRGLAAEYRTVGLLHDVGKLLLVRYFPNRFEAIVRRQREYGGCSFYTAELSLGYEGQTHCEIGGYFLDWWNLPAAFVDAALFHRSPEKAAGTEREFLHALAVTNRMLARACNHDRYGSGALAELEVDGLGSERIEELGSAMREDWRRQRALLSG